MTKPTAREVWRQLVDEAGEDEIAAILSLTQDQVDAELAGVPGFDAKKEQAAADRFLEDLASGALEESMGLGSLEQPASAVVAIAQPQPRAVPERRRRPRTTMVLLFAAIAAAAAAGAAYVTLRDREPAPAPPSPQPSPEPSPSPSFAPPQRDLAAAADWRNKAIGACDAQKWEECLADLDIARSIDPDGDDTALVKSTRDRAIKGVLAKPPKPDKPPVP
ncbi:MAG TPA: hypothetical protein VF765_29425 [Polyangiaceae bacterium]